MPNAKKKKKSIAQRSNGEIEKDAIEIEEFME